MTDRRRVTTLVAIAVAALAAAGGSASGSGGGIGTPEPPQVRDVICISGCLDLREVAAGGEIEITGRSLASVEEVDFRGGAVAEAKVSDDSSLTATVPAGAEAGRLSVRTAAGMTARSPVAIEVRPAKALTAKGGFEVTRAVAKPSKSFFDGKRRISLRYNFKGRSEADVRVDVVARESGEVVDSIVQRDRQPFANQRARWNGLDADNKIPAGGKYRFEVTPLGTIDGEATSAKFRYYDHIFPLRSKRRRYGDGLGAGRNHQGQDVFARCGTKVVAARGGKVQESEYHSAAGYYVVIDGARTKRDYTYMHLERRGRPKVGQRIRTGQRIGFVSDTGRASGCHLHFELWSAPGWYEGGSPLNPTRPLKRWGKYS